MNSATSKAGTVIVSVDAPPLLPGYNDVTAVTPAVENRLAQRRAEALATMEATMLRHGPGKLSMGDRYQVGLSSSCRSIHQPELLQTQLSGRSAWWGV